MGKVKIPAFFIRENRDSIRKFVRRFRKYLPPEGGRYLKKRHYSLTLPAEMPLMMYLEKKQNAIMMGTAEMATTR